jgi:hypothetical protein
MAFIAKIIRSMREFQEKNGIKKQCVTNAQYLYDCIKINHSSANVKVKALMVISTDDYAETCTCVSGHLAIILVDDETLIDPSYDVFSLKNKSYFDNIKDLMDSFDDKDSLKKKFDIKTDTATKLVENSFISFGIRQNQPIGMQASNTRNNAGSIRLARRS